MSEALRRPLHSPALGIPDMMTSFARANQVAALVGNKKWTTNLAPVVGTGAPIIAATLSMKALATGRFRVRASGVVSSNSLAGGNSLIMGVSHGTGVTVANYAQPGVDLPATGGEIYVGVGWMALIVDFTSIASPFTAAVGSTTALNLIMNASDSSVEFQANGLQFEAEEF